MAKFVITFEFKGKTYNTETINSYREMEDHKSFIEKYAKVVRVNIRYN